MENEMRRAPVKAGPLEIPDITPLRGCERGALLVRHAARHGGDIALHSDGLTPAGREQARKLGERLDGKKLRLFSSPIQRCVDTASLIAEGAGSDAEVTISTMLGKPGTFVIDEAEVDRHLAVMGLHNFAVEWVMGKIPSKTMAPVSQGSEDLMRWVTRQLREEETCLDLYVGHDLFLTPILVHYVGYDIVNNGLLGFLDGFTLVRKGGKTILISSDKRVHL